MKKLCLLLAISTLFLWGCRAEDSALTSESFAPEAFTPEVSEMYAEMAAYRPTIAVFQCKGGKMTEKLGDQIAKEACQALGIDPSCVAKVEKVYRSRDNCYSVSDTSVAIKLKDPDLMPALLEYLYHRADYGKIKLMDLSLDEDLMTEEEKKAYLFAQVATEPHEEGVILLRTADEKSTSVDTMLALVCKFHEKFGVPAETVASAHENAQTTTGKWGDGIRYMERTAYFDLDYTKNKDGSIYVLNLIIRTEEANLAEGIWYLRGLEEVTAAGMNGYTILQ